MKVFARGSFFSKPKLKWFIVSVLFFSHIGEAFPNKKCKSLEVLGNELSLSNRSSVIVKNYRNRRRRAELGIATSLDPGLSEMTRNLSSNFPDLFEKLAEQNGDQTTLLTIADQMKYLSREDIQQFISDPKLLESTLRELEIGTDPGSNGKASKIAQTYARALVLAEFIMSERKKTNFYSLESFKTLLQLEDLKPKKFSQVFRYDSRSPSDIKRQRGFFPVNPLGTIVGHSDRFSKGSSFISFSTVEGNQFNLAIAPVVNSLQKLPKEGMPSHLQEEISNYKSDHPRKVLFHGRLFEFRASEIEGVEPHKNASIKGEAEVVFPFVSRSNITSYREVFVVVERKWSSDWSTEYKPSILGVEFGPWQPF